MMVSFIKKYWLWVAASIGMAAIVALIGGKTILFIFVLGSIGAILFAKPLWALYILVPSLFLEAEQFSLYIGDWRGRLYHFLVAVLVARMVYEYLTLSAPYKGKGSPVSFLKRELWGVSRLDKALVAFLAVQGVAITFSPDRAYSFKIWILQIILALLFWCVRYFVATHKEWKRLLNIFLISSAAEALIGLWQVFAFYLQKTTGIIVRWAEVFHANVLEYGRPYGTFMEADWYGAFMAIPLIISIVLMAGAENKKMRMVYALLSFVFGIAVIISGVRAAWIALIVAGALGFVILRKCDANIRMHANDTNVYREYKHLAWLGAVCAGIIVMMLAVASPSWVGQIGDRFISMFQPSVWAQEPRVATTQKAFELIAQSPLIGHGPGSYKILGIVPDIDPSRYDYYGVHPYLTNYFLTVLHDSGIIGLGVFLWLLVEGVMVVKGILRIPHPNPLLEKERGYGIAVVMGLVVLMIAYLITTGFWLGMTWFLFGMMISGVSMNEAEGMKGGA